VSAHGVLYVHSAPPALCPHIEWAVAGIVGAPVGMSWVGQPAAPGALRAELVWRATKKDQTIPDLEFDPDSLKMIVKCHKRRQAALARKGCEMKEKARSIKSMEYSPEQIFGIEPAN